MFLGGEMFEYEYLQDYNRLESVIYEILSSPKQWLGCDTETTGLNCHLNKLSTIQISTYYKTYVIDIFSINGWQELFKKLTQVKTLNWVFHNFKFDIQFFWKNGIDFYGCRVLDTMIVSALLSAGLNLDNDLASVCERHLNLEVDKTEQKSDWSIRPLSESQLYYAAKDAYSTRLLGQKLVKLIESTGITEVFKLEMRALYSFASMEYFGMNIDLDRLDTLRPIYEDKLKRAESDVLNLAPNRYIRNNILGDIIDTGLDLKSPGQVLKVLREAGIPNPLYDEKGKTVEQLDTIITSTGSDVLKLLDITEYPLLEYLLSYRKSAKLLDAYIYSLPTLVNPVTKKLHTYFRQTVSTGRASSSSPNLQNLSRPDGSELNLRSCFIPSEGFVLADADFSQIELRVIAEVIFEMSGDRTMLNEFLAGKDPYAATAALLSNLKYEDIVDNENTILKQYKTLRQNAKAVRLGYNYSMGAKKFKTYAKITYGVSFTQAEADANRKLYFSAYPGLIVYHDSFKDKSIRMVNTLPPFNRPRYFDEYPGIPALSNHPIQGSSADIQKLSMALMYETLHAKGYSPTQSHNMRQVCTIHDELVSEAIPELSDEICYIQQNSMESAAKYVLNYCPIEAKANIIANLALKS